MRQRDRTSFAWHLLRDARRQHSGSTEVCRLLMAVLRRTHRGGCHPPLCVRYFVLFVIDLQPGECRSRAWCGSPTVHGWRRSRATWPTVWTGFWSASGTCFMTGAEEVDLQRLGTARTVCRADFWRGCTARRFAALRSAGRAGI